MMAVTFTFAATLTVTLTNPSLNARSLVRHLAASKKSFDGIMSALLSFIPDIHEHEHVLLAVEAVRQFYNPITPTFEQKLIDKMSEIAPVLFPHMVTALHLSFKPAGGFHLSDARAALIAALNTLLLHESGIKHFAESDALTQHIDVLIKLWISFSSSAVYNPVATDLVNIIDTLFNYLPTREALEYVVSNSKRPLFCKGLERLLVTSDNLDNPKFPLCASLTTNMCGLGVLGRARPSLRRLFFHHGALDALCRILRRVVMEDTSNLTPAQKRAAQYGPAYDLVLAVCHEMSVLLTCEVSSYCAVERALKCGLLEIIVHAVSVFGPYMLTPCGAMPSLLRYISDWCLKSRRIAIRVHDELADLEDDTELWQSLPNLPSPNELTVAFHDFLDEIERKVVLFSPENAKIIIPCMNPECEDKVCESKRYKRCANCKAFVVCSPECFEAAWKAGHHTPAACKKSPDDFDVPVL